MGRLRNRIARLEERSAERTILETSLRESGLSAPEWHWRRALARATQDELGELARCRAAVEEARHEDGEEASEPERPHDSAELAHLKIVEIIMRREAPSLADDIRTRRDLLWRELDRLRDEWEEQGRHKSTSYSDPGYWHLATAEVNRRTAIRRGVPLVMDPEEVGRRIEHITDPATTTDEVLRLVGWRG